MQKFKINTIIKAVLIWHQHNSIVIVVFNELRLSDYYDNYCFLILKI